MNATNPIIIDDEVYSKYSANLAVTSFYKEGGGFEVNAALRLVPTRIDQEGNVVRKDSHYKSVLLGSLSAASSQEQEAINQIYNAIQSYISIKEL